MEYTNEQYAEWNHFMHVRDIIQEEMETGCYEAINVIQESKISQPEYFKSGHSPEDTAALIIKNHTGKLWAFFKDEDEEPGTQLVLF